MKGAFNNGGPLQTANDKRVGPGPLGLHELAFYERAEAALQSVSQNKRVENIGKASL